jgi:hypothetical protein
VAVHVPEKFSRTFRRRAYARVTVGHWQIGGPAFVAIGRSWNPFPPGASTASAGEFRHVTDEIMARIEALLDTARSVAG